MKLRLGRFRSLARLLDQLRHALGRLGALADPVVGALEVDLQRNFLTGSHRVEETQTLNEATIARIAAVGDNDLIERPLFRTATCKTNRNHAFRLPFGLLASGKKRPPAL